MARATATGFRAFLRDRFGMRGLMYSLLALFVGTALGLAVFTFGYAGGIHYLSDSPETCAQCHAMDDHYDAWLKGSHAAVATCNDCHSPHDNVVYAYWNKADNGFWHALKFTTNDYPTNIQIRDTNRRITESACLHCHEDVVHAVNMTRSEDEKISCIQCHSEVGHKR